MKGNEIKIRRYRQGQRLSQLIGVESSTALPSQLSPSMVHQDAANHLGGNRKKVGTAFPMWIFLAAQPQIHLVNQRRALQGLGSGFLFYIVVGQTPNVPIAQ